MTQLSDDCFAFGGPLLGVEACGVLIRDRIVPIAAIEHVSLAGADGSVLAQDVPALVSLPPFDNSAVDGYAVRHADLTPGDETVMHITARLPAGADAGSIAAHGAVRIFTGAVMPAGFDTVFMQEDVALEGNRVRLPRGLKSGANRRLAGEDIAAGEIALRQGRRLGPCELALAAATGHATLAVRRPITVGVFSTGDELREPGTALSGAAIYDANRAMLLALVARLGVVARDLGILRDNPATLAPAIAAAAEHCDLILTSGGVSTGEEDHVKAAIEALGKLDFWRVAIKPGRPVAMGMVRGKPIVGLPGNPVAAFVTFTAIVRPLIAQLMGADAPLMLRVPVRLGFAYKKKSGRREYVRVSLHAGADGMLEATKYPRDGAGVITSMTATDGLVELAEETVDLAAGTTVSFLSWKELM
ncbi:MAG: molybdopterin molybdotransferase MoeA [Bosea sp. (in: a-proteobacteria)]